jgi:putative aldouronate transport system permease protein
MIRSFSDKVFDAMNSFLLVIVGLITLFPIYYVVCVSFTGQQESLKGGLILFPRAFTFENYHYILSMPSFYKATGISAFLAIVGTLLSLIVTSMLAYSLSRKSMAGRKAILIMVLFTMLFNPGMIPPYMLIRNMGLIDSIWALILPALSSGWNVFLLKSFFESIPESLEEAAIIDGCNQFGVWWKIILPLSLPAMATFGLFFAVAYWNTFFSALLYINDSNKWPLQLVLRAMFVNNSANDIYVSGIVVYNPEVLKMAAVVVTILPIIMVYPFLQKHFAKGVMVGSVKE